MYLPVGPLTGRLHVEVDDRAFAALVEHCSDLIVVVDRDGTLLYANPAAARLFGVPVEDAVGTTAFNFLHLGDHDRLNQRFAHIGGTPGASDRATLRIVSALGEVRVLETVVTNCLDNDEISGIVVNGRDVTEVNDYIAKLETSFNAITESVAGMVELRDPYTAGHQREVAHLAAAIARRLGLVEDDIKGIEVAAMIHDIGKIAIPAEILARPGALSPAEFEIVRTHSQAGHDIVANIPFPWPVAEMILQHHERMDGSGYPRGLLGSDILPGSRIIAVADTVSAMAGHRPYRPALGLSAALEEVERGSGVLFDSQAAHACVKLFREDDYSL